MIDLTINSSLLLEQLIEAASERGILIADSASLEELQKAQVTIDTISEELLRRMSW